MQIDSDIFQAVGFAVMFLFFVAIAWLIAEFKGMKDEFKERMGINNETIKLRLQSYERLTLFAERAGLQSLVSRIGHAGDTVARMQVLMISEIRSEYEYNLSQQVYVSEPIWRAITKLKDQNIYIINQIASILAPDADGLELCRGILEYSTNENAELNVFVLNALKMEAKKLL